MADEIFTYFKVILALGFVVGLIFTSAALVKKTGLDKRITGNKGTTPRLSVVETLYLDPKHRMVIVKCDEKEHLLMLGVNTDLVVDAHIKGANS
jgi:flagellar protein FliO/FliZ